jgi:hypothetical protein
MSLEHLERRRSWIHGLHERSLKRETPHQTKHAERRRFTTLAWLGILATILEITEINL